MRAELTLGMQCLGGGFLPHRGAATAVSSGTALTKVDGLREGLCHVVCPSNAENFGTFLRIMASAGERGGLAAMNASPAAGGNQRRTLQASAPQKKAQVLIETANAARLPAVQGCRCVLRNVPPLSQPSEGGGQA